MTNNTENLNAPATQLVHPVKAALRTGVQTFLATAVILAIVAPELQSFLNEWWPGSPVIAWIGVAAAFVASVAALISRLMAVPVINDYLTKMGLGAEPKSNNPTSVG